MLNESIKRVIEECGSQKALAIKVNASQQSVSKWLNGHGINSKYIPLIAKASNGKVTETDILRSLSE